MDEEDKTSRLSQISSVPLRSQTSIDRHNFYPKSEQDGVKMRIYLDVCCLNRPYDDQTQDRIHLESEAVIAILRHMELGKWSMVSSGVVNYEIGQTSDEERIMRLRSLVRLATEFVSIGQETFVRSRELQHTLGIGAYDALHIACAKQGRADIFLSTDDKLVKAAKRYSSKTNVKVDNPLIWLQEVI